MPNFWACFASAAMASSLACVLGAPPLRASSIAASHFALLSNPPLPSPKKSSWLYPPSTSRTLWFSARSATKRSTPSAAMWVRAVRRMSCTVKCSMSSSGRGGNATVSGARPRWAERVALRHTSFHVDQPARREQVLAVAREHLDLLQPPQDRRRERDVDGLVDGLVHLRARRVQRPDATLQVELGPPGRQQLHLAHAQGEQQPHGQLVLATEVGRVLHGLGECGKFLAVQPALS